MKTEIILEVENEYDAVKFEKIFRVLIEKGALSGVRGGKTIIHFDEVGNFRGVSFDYMVWKEPRA